MARLNDKHVNTRYLFQRRVGASTNAINCITQFRTGSRGAGENDSMLKSIVVRLRFNIGQQGSVSLFPRIFTQNIIIPPVVMRANNNGIIGFFV